MGGEGSCAVSPFRAEGVVNYWYCVCRLYSLRSMLTATWGRVGLIQGLFTAPPGLRLRHLEWDNYRYSVSAVKWSQRPSPAQNIPRSGINNAFDRAQEAVSNFGKAASGLNVLQPKNVKANATSNLLELGHSGLVGAARELSP